LAFIPGRVKQFANFILVFITFGGIYTHLMIGDKFESKSSFRIQLIQLFS
jgi:hypothetical protein